MATKLRIEIVSDVICPWCYIGKRRLEKALESLRGEAEIELAWMPYQLNPEMPQQGVAREAYRRAKFGSLQHSKALDARVAAEGRGEGIEFAFERMARTPNTFAAHQLIELAQEQGRGDAVVEALFHAYFEEARDTGDREVLKDIAARCGLEPAALEARWADPQASERVAVLERNLKALGIGGVPTFLFERRFGVSGAQPPEALAAAIREALAEPAAAAR